MKHFKKSIAVILALVLAFSLSVPAFAAIESGEGNVGDHTTPDEFWDETTDENGTPDISKLPLHLVAPYLMTYVIETIMGFLRDLYDSLIGSFGGIFDGLNNGLDGAIENMPEKETIIDLDNIVPTTQATETETVAEAA